MFIQYFLYISDEPILSFQRNSFFPLQEERKVGRYVSQTFLYRGTTNLVQLFKFWLFFLLGPLPIVFTLEIS